ncbi:MAG TPA: MoxR family ATPase [Chloroflexota bacterium]|jgi:MoxR-like ATPase|nr:MoxR family ATPase [Chloroflexota bacterium]
MSSQIANDTSSAASGLSPQQVREVGTQLEQAIGQALVGQGEVIRQTLLALLAGGHVLLEGVPGLGKTLLVRSVGQSLSLRFSRIQFTPDLMPADCTGTNIIGEDESGRRSFQFQPGPLFANVVLADEINRATPKTQSALLEAMQEHTVTVGETTRRLPEPFFVLATQNPLEMEGTYPLPEAQLDRFFFKILVPFPEAEVLRGIVQRTIQPPEGIEPVADGSQLLAMRAVAREVPVAGPVVDYAVALVLATHPERADARPPIKQYVRAGVSPRGLQTLITGAQVQALLEGRFNAAIDDIRTLALPALRHRILLNFEAQADGLSPDQVIADLLEALDR